MDAMQIRSCLILGSAANHSRKYIHQSSGCLLLTSGLPTMRDLPESVPARASRFLSFEAVPHLSILFGQASIISDDLLPLVRMFCQNLDNLSFQLGNPWSLGKDSFNFGHVNCLYPFDKAIRQEVTIESFYQDCAILYF
jgi:hypothetical protein